MTICPRSATKHSVFLVVLATVLCAWALTVGAAEREHGSHVHGVGNLNVAIDGTTVEIEFESPGANIVGFEHAAKTAKDRATIEKAAAGLKAGDKLFAFPEAAECRLTDAEVETPDTHDHDKHAHEKTGASDDAHSEFDAHYRYRCDQPARLTHIDVNVFRLFPATRTLEVQAISPRGQHAQTLTPTAPRLTF